MYSLQTFILMHFYPKRPGQKRDAIGLVFVEEYLSDWFFNIKQFLKQGYFICFYRLFSISL